VANLWALHPSRAGPSFDGHFDDYPVHSIRVETNADAAAPGNVAPENHKALSFSFILLQLQLNKTGCFTWRHHVHGHSKLRRRGDVLTLGIIDGVRNSDP